MGERRDVPAELGVEQHVLWCGRDPLLAADDVELVLNLTIPAAHAEVASIGRRLAESSPDDIQLWRHISRCLNDIGDIRKRGGESEAALAA